MLKRFTQFIDYWVPAHLKGDGDPYLKGRLMVQSFLMVMPLMTFYGILYPILGHPFGGLLACMGLVNAGWGIFDFRKRGQLGFSGNLFAGTSYVIVAGLLFTTGGMNFIAPWVILAPVSGFLLVGIRSGVFWSVAAMVLVTMMFALQWAGIPVPNLVDPSNGSFLDFFSLSGFIGYVVFILLNNDLSKMRMLNALRDVQAAMADKNREITAINHTLENTVAKRTENLLAANEELDTFLYESSHALRRPLMRILGLMSLVETERDPAEKAQYMELMSYTAHNMDKMLQDLLLVSEVYKKELVAQGADLGVEVHHLIGQLQAPDVVFVEEIPQGLRLPLDVELLQMILKKLLDNAVFYRRREVTHTVKVSAQSQDEACLVCIEDNGIGIDPVAIPQLFKMFARGSERSRGSGLGLFIVAKAMDRLGGRVWIESEKGLRTAIYLRFPLD